jgi:hypothetical protein
MRRFERKVVRVRGEPREWATTRGGWMELVKQVRAYPNGLSIRTLGDRRAPVNDDPVARYVRVT